MLKNIKSKILFFIRKHFFDGITIRKNATVSSSKLSEWVHISNNTNIVESNIGRYSSIGKFSNIFYVEMGAFCSISWNVTIGATQHNINYLTTHAFPYISMFDLATSNQRKKRKTKIGHDVWIGTGAIIMPGISVGNGSVIGAGSIVTKDVKAYSIVAGNPAKLIRMRFDGDLINKIESLKWWHWDSSYLRDNIDVFKQNISSSILNSIDSH